MYDPEERLFWITYQGSGWEWEWEWGLGLGLGLGLGSRLITLQVIIVGFVQPTDQFVLTFIPMEGLTVFCTVRVSAAFRAAFGPRLMAPVWYDEGVCWIMD